MVILMGITATTLSAQPERGGRQSQLRSQDKIEEGRMNFNEMLTEELGLTEEQQAKLLELRPQRTGEREAGLERMSREFNAETMAEHMASRLAGQLDLSDAQKARVKELQLGLMDESAYAVDMRGLNEEQRAQLREEKQKRFEAYNAELEKILSDEQLNKWNNLGKQRDDRQERMERMAPDRESRRMEAPTEGRRRGPHRDISAAPTSGLIYNWTPATPAGTATVQYETPQVDFYISAEGLLAHDALFKAISHILEQIS